MKAIKAYYVLCGFGCLLLLTIPIAAVVGKYQLCTHYFPSINTYACLFTSLPGTMTERK